METIIFKAPNGTRMKLKRLNPNVSELLREQAARLLSGGNNSARDKAAHLCGALKSGRRNLATGRDYLQPYAKKNVH